MQKTIDHILSALDAGDRDTVNEHIRILKEQVGETQNREKTFLALFNSMTEMVVLHEMIYDDEGRAVDYTILDCNPKFTELTGITRERAAGKRASELYGRSLPRFLDVYAEVLRTGEPKTYTSYFEEIDRHFKISVVSPSPGRFATIASEITEIKQIEKELSVKNGELENYLYIASHDLRSPLINIQGFARRLEGQMEKADAMLSPLMKGRDDAAEFDTLWNHDIPSSLKTIHANVDKIESLLNGLLQISRTGRETMNAKTVDMNGLLKQVTDNLKFEMTQVTVDVKIAELPPCFGDESLLERVFHNLLSNALKYRKQGRPLEIKIQGQKQYNRIRYSVEDNGRGISPRHLGKIWDVFYRVDSRAAESGEGIGLSIVKQITEMHRGRVAVESEEGAGTKFIIELPSVK